MFPFGLSLCLAYCSCLSDTRSGCAYRVVVLIFISEPFVVYFGVFSKTRFYFLPCGFVIFSLTPVHLKLDGTSSRVIRVTRRPFRRALLKYSRSLWVVRACDAYRMQHHRQHFDQSGECRLHILMEHYLIFAPSYKECLFSEPPYPLHVYSRPISTSSSD